MKGAGADGGVGVGLGGGGVNGADGEVIDGEVGGGVELGLGVGGEAEEGVGADDAAGFGGGQVRLAEVEAEAEEGGIVGAIIQDEVGLEAGALLEGGDEGAVERGFMADLDPGSAAVESGGKNIGESMSVEVGGIQDRVEGHLFLNGGLVIVIGPSGYFQAAANPAESLLGIRSHGGAADRAFEGDGWFFISLGLFLLA